MTEKSHSGYRFDEFELDLTKRRLLRNGEAVALKPRAFDVLAVLVAENGHLVTKDEIFRRIWGDQIVEETNLTVNISAIRRSLGETASAPRFIVNVPGRGYYFNATELEVAFKPKLNGNGHSNGHGNGHLAVVDQPLAQAPVQVPPQSTRRSRLAFGAAAVLLVGLGVFAYLYFRASKQASQFAGFSTERLTTTGRSASAAVSPDGRVYAYSQVEPDGKHSLWLAQVDGSGRVQLREPKEFPITGLAFSPDGKRLYFAEFEPGSFELGTLYRMPSIGGVVERVHEQVATRIAFSPDGKEFAFVRPDRAAGRADLIAAGSEPGSGERILASRLYGDGGLSPALSWSPDGRSIAIAARTSTLSPGPTEVFAIDASSGEFRQITKQGWYSIGSVAWSRDAEKLIAAVGEASSDVERQIVEISASTGEIKRLLADFSSYASLSTSTDGSVLLGIQTSSLSNVWVAPSNDLASAKQVTFDMIGKSAGWNTVEWTNDGKLIYSGRVGKSDTIWEMAADGSGQRQIIAETGRSEYASLPDDGSFVVFTSNRSGGSEIWRADRDGSHLMQLTTSGNNENANVSPDGQRVLYASGDWPNVHLFNVPASGGDPQQLTRETAAWARYSPDGRQIACIYQLGTKPKLAIIDADGGEPTSIFDLPATANYRLGVRWTRDGTAITFRDWQNGIWKQPLSGGPPARIPGLPAEKLFAYSWSRDGQWFAFTRGQAISDVILLTSLQ